MSAGSGNDRKNLSRSWLGTSATPYYRRFGAVVVDATRPAEMVVDEVLAAATN
jgi:hypothetical protein